jgi:hypothetical protein
MAKEIKYKIRQLKRRDRKTVSDMIVKMSDKVGNAGILNIVSTATKPGSEKAGGGDSGNTENNMIGIGIEIIKQALTVLDEDVAAWFADLIGKTTDEFNDCDLDVEIQIIAQLKEAPEVGAFFSGAYQQFKEIKKYQAKLQGEKTK